MVAVATFVADTTTPVRAYAALRRAAGDSASFLLESATAGERWGRHSVIGYRPRHEVTLQSSGHWVGAHGLPHGMRPVAGARDPFDAARSLFDPGESGGASDHPAARFARSYFGYVGWEAVHVIDRTPGSGPRGSSPLARFFGGATVVVFDALSPTATIAAEDAADVERARGHLDRPPASSPIQVPSRAQLPDDLGREVEDVAFEALVRRAQERIAADEVLEVVLSRKFTVPRAGRDPFDAYRAMRVLGPSPTMVFFDLPPAPGERTRTQIAGASAETLARRDNPGARPLDVLRAAFPSASLSGDPKDRAVAIIREIEPGPRGLYGGAVGYIGKAGDLDFASAARTVVCKDDRFVVSTGARVVAATDPASAAQETSERAFSMLAAVAAAGRSA